MNIENYVDKIFNEIVQDYENEKMIQEGGVLKRTTAYEFLGGLKNV